MLLAIYFDVCYNSDDIILMSLCLRLSARSRSGPMMTGIALVLIDMRAASENAGHCACVLLVVVITSPGTGPRAARNSERTGSF